MSTPDPAWLPLDGELERMMLRVHGLTAGDACPGCSRTWSLAEVQSLPERCPDCRRPLPVRCHADCGALVDPGGEPGAWQRPAQLCPRCVVTMRALAAGVPRALDEAARDLRSYRHRVEARSALQRWLDGVLGAVYVHGNVGAGKSVLLAWALRRLLESQPDATALWVTEGELLDAAKTRYDRDDSRSRDLLRLAAEVDVLVVDELFSRGGGWSEFAARTVSDLLARQLERGRVLIASNEPPRWAEVLDTRVASRFGAVGEVVEVRGSDLRRRRLQKGAEKSMAEIGVGKFNEVRWNGARMRFEDPYAGRGM